MTLADVAKASNVSPATVSLVLRGKAGVGQQTRQRVLDAAQALGYIHKPSVSSDTQTADRTVGLIMRIRHDDAHLGENSFYAPVLSGIEYICRRGGVNLLFSNLPVDEANYPLEIPHLIRNEQLDGVLLVGMFVSPALQAVLIEQGLPVVLVDAYAQEETSFDSVLSDNEQGSFLATQTLIAHGHRAIGIVGSSETTFPSIQERRAGYLRAMQQAQLTPHFIDCELRPEAAEAAVFDYLQAHEEITAVFGSNDAVTMAAMRAATALGKSIPYEMSFIGFDNILAAQHVSPPLSTMRVDKAGMGRLAAQLLFNRLEFPKASPVRTILQTQLISRDSVHLLS